MSDFFENQKKVNDAQDKDQEYYNNFKIALKEYKASNNIEWYLKTEINAKLMLFLKEVLKAKHQAEEEYEFKGDLQSLGRLNSYQNTIMIFERIFGSKQE